MAQHSRGRIIMIHGVKHQSRGRDNMKGLLPPFLEAGFNIISPKYGFVPAVVVGMFQWVDNRLADSMTSFIQPNDILLGYSNGGTIAYMITQQIKVRGVILVNPALENDLLPNASFVHVYYNSGDRVTQASALIPWHLWGSMGQTGYQGPPQLHVTNIDQGNPPVATLPKLDGHTDLFKDQHVAPWGTYMAKMTVQTVKALAQEQANAPPPSPQPTL